MKDFRSKVKSLLLSFSMVGLVSFTSVFGLPVYATEIEFIDETRNGVQFEGDLSGLKDDAGIGDYAVNPLGREDGVADSNDVPESGENDKTEESQNPGSSSDTNDGLANPNLVPSGSYDPGFVPSEGIDLHGIYLGGSGEAEEVYEGAETDTDSNRGTSDETVKEQIKNKNIVSFLSGFAQGLFYTLGVAMLVYSLALWCSFVLARSTVLIPKKIFYILTFKQLDVYEISILNFVFRQVIITAIASLFITGWAFEAASYFVAWVVYKLQL